MAEFDGATEDRARQQGREEFFAVVAGAQARLDEGFAGLPEFGGRALDERAAAVLGEAAERLWDNYPYGHPLYAGQMLKPPHPVARAAYAMAMAVNPNNHALDGGRASSAMEVEAVGQIAAMFGLPQHLGGFLGHLTSGGTMANLEALWVGGRLRPGLAVAASAQAHYTHERVSGVLGLGFVSVAVDARNRMDMGALEEALATGEVGTVVATLGTTATGAVDPLPEILTLAARYGARVHVDAAYGGYFRLAGNLEAETTAAYAAISEADSIVVDPHKHGLQPYGCGCVLFRDTGVGRLYKHDSPYTYFTSGELHLGEITLECSRAGAAAVALWTTMRLLPLERGGEFAKGLEDGRAAALNLYRRLNGGAGWVVPEAAPELDIVVWAVAAGSVEEASALAQRVFDEAAKLDLHLALARLPVGLFPALSWADAADGSTVMCLRSVLMKPEHRVWMGAIWERLEAALGVVQGVVLGGNAMKVSGKG